MNWLTFYDEYLIKMTSEQNNPNKLELILYKQFTSSLEFYRIYLVGRHFPNSFTVFCCRSVYVNHISNKMQYNSDSQPPVHRLLMVYKASEKASTKSLQRCPHKSTYVCIFIQCMGIPTFSFEGCTLMLPGPALLSTFSQLLFLSVGRHCKETCRSH